MLRCMELEGTVSLVNLDALSPAVYFPLHHQTALHFKETVGACLWVDPKVSSQPNSPMSYRVPLCCRP